MPGAAGPGHNDNEHCPAIADYNSHCPVSSRVAPDSTSLFKQERRNDARRTLIHSQIVARNSKRTKRTWSVRFTDRVKNGEALAGGALFGSGGNSVRDTGGTTGADALPPLRKGTHSPRSEQKAEGVV